MSLGLCLYDDRMGTRIVDAWNGWYHLNGSTYGTWLRGDARGWRARHHREHVEGDYRNPPSEGTYDRLLARSESLLARAPIKLSVQARSVACIAMVEKLEALGREPVACAVDDHHFHVLARFTLPEFDPNLPGPIWMRTRHAPIYAYIRHIMGRAKASASFALVRDGLAQEGGVWALRFKTTAIADRAHQVAVLNYILAHREQGAATWSFRDRE